MSEVGASSPSRRRKIAAAHAALEVPLPLEKPVSREFAPVLPLFYKDPVPLAAARHADWQLLGGGAGFAAQATAIPLVVTDFAAASRHYPILFTAGVASPVALVGLERLNLFVDDGRWAGATYVPAYVRRYPFVLIEAGDKSGFALAIDQASTLIAREGAAGEPLFEAGEPSATTKRALEFCRLFNVDFEAVRTFAQALADAQLLVARKADVILPGGRKLEVAGFTVVDPEKFAALSEETVLAWHRKGWLALIHFHLASLERFADLLDRQNQREAAAANVK